MDKKRINKPGTILIIALAYLLTCTQAFAQSPEKMSYQAVVRDGDHNLITGTAIGMQISILKSSPTGTSVYTETQKPTTNSNGLVTVEIGTGTVQNGDFSAIDWANDTYFIKTEIDPAGGTTYTIAGTSQLISVSYALHAKTVTTETDPAYTASQAANITATDITNLSNLTGTNTGDQDVLELNNTTAFTPDADYEPATKKYVDDNSASEYYVGELHEGGIICYIDHTGEHGLIASLDDLNEGNEVRWSNILSAIGTEAQDFYNGKGNTAAIIAQKGHSSSAAQLCIDYSNDGFTDWYLPALVELRRLVDVILIINDVLVNDAVDTTNPMDFTNVAPTYSKYWSSTELPSYNAWYYWLNRGRTDGVKKNLTTCRVRAVRAF